MTLSSFGIELRKYSQISVIYYHQKALLGKYTGHWGLDNKQLYLTQRRDF